MHPAKTLMIILGINLVRSVFAWNSMADPGFLERGFKFTKGGGVILPYDLLYFPDLFENSP